MQLRLKINERLDQLQKMLESNQHLEDPELVYAHTLTISKFWSALDEKDRDYIQSAQIAIEEKIRWIT